MVRGRPLESPSGCGKWGVVFWSLLRGYKRSEERQEGFQKSGSVIETRRFGPGHSAGFLEERRRIFRRCRYQ